MEELYRNITDLIDFTDSLSAERDFLIEEHFKKLEAKWEAAKNSLKSPKKAPKKLSVVRSQGNSTDLDDADVTEKENISSKLNRIRSIEVPHPKKSNSFKETLETRNVEPAQNLRPVRTAKTKAAEHLLEPKLNSKMRNETTITTAAVKIERNSIDVRQIQGSLAKEPTFTDEQLPESAPKVVETAEKLSTGKRKPSRKISQDSNIDEENSNEGDVGNKKVKMSGGDDSLVILRNLSEKIVSLSDDDNMMPPPPAPIPDKAKPKLRAKKPTKQQDEDGVNPEITIKQERFSADAQLVAPEEKRSTKSKVRKGKKPARKFSESEDIKPIILPEITSIENTTIKATLSQITVVDKATSVANTTAESVYEDAMSVNNEIMVAKKIGECTVILNSRNPNETVTLGKNQGNPNETVTLGKNSNNNSPQPNSTFVLEKQDSSENRTFAVTSTNQTFNVEPGNKDTNNVTNSSLITEDASVASPEVSLHEFPTPKPRVPPKPMASNSKLPIISSKNKNEIFNPLVSSPVKKKVEAYEKHTSAIAASPAVQRVTRTKNRERNENMSPSEMMLDSEHQKPETPLTEIKWNKFNTPVFGGATKKTDTSKLYSSTSKLAHIQKSKSRENSAEDKKRGADNIVHMLAEARKKKREEKQRQAQIQREAKEREKIEIAEKKAREKEEISRRLMHEREEKLRLEKEEKMRKKIAREQKYKEEQLRKIEEHTHKMNEAKKNEATDMIKKATDLMAQYSNEKLKEMAKKELINNAYKKKFECNSVLKKLAYDFDMLQSGDSTDEEGKQSKRKKRPPPPEWSTSANRGLSVVRLSYLSTKIIDNFFSVQPMSPDLKEIFPTIDDRYLKRNSSAIWATPPRYSELPKY